MSDISTVKYPSATLPFFHEIAERNAMAMTRYSSEELQKMLKINAKLAAENYIRYRNFVSDEHRKLPALLAYTGVVFKHIAPESFSESDWMYAEEHMLISSFLYGLLKPTDLINNYRLEGNVSLDINDGKTMFDFWKPVLTDYFIDIIRKNGGVLFNLASAEMRNLFDWKKVCSSVNVVTPEFYINKGGKLKNVVIYSKMCRGEMTKYIMKNRIELPEDLRFFEWEGFRFDAGSSTSEKMVFVL